MENKRELNFLDLCAACGRAIGRACVAFGQLLGKMLRLSIRYWWIVGTLVVLSIAGALYYSRLDNLKFKVNAIALLNGPTIQQFQNSFAPLCTGQMLPPEAPITPFIWGKKATAFRTFRVIDCLNDETMDFIDFRYKSKPGDTINVQMQDRLCVQFRIKRRDLPMLPVIEHSMLELLNSNPAMQQAYEVYMKNLRYEVAFNHRQAEKLDSLTSCYYFYPAVEATPFDRSYNSGTGVNFYGDREIILFLKDIYEQHAHVQHVDQRLQLATAPVTLENHFAVDPKPVNGRMKCLVLFFLFGWILGCAIAEAVDKRKELCAWLKQ